MPRRQSESLSLGGRRGDGFCLTRSRPGPARRPRPAARAVSSVSPFHCYSRLVLSVERLGAVRFHVAHAAGKLGWGQLSDWSAVEDEGDGGARRVLAQCP